MCLDIAFYSALELIDNYFPGLVHDGAIPFDLEIGQHVFALGHKKYPVVVDQQGKLHRKSFEWGIIAEYMNTPEKVKAIRKSMVNARSEKILGDPRSFWHRIRQTRCLVPVTGIYEHREVPGLKNKVPYYIQLRDRPLFCLPALYHYNTALPSDPETGEVRGMFTLVTRAANPLMRQIHNSGDNAFRMPLFLTREMERRWLQPDLEDSALQTLLEYELPSSAIEYTTVFSIRSRQPRPDGKPKIAHYEFSGVPDLTREARH